MPAGATQTNRDAAEQRFEVLREGRAPAAIPLEVKRLGSHLEAGGIHVDVGSVRQARADASHAVYTFVADGRICWLVEERSGSAGGSCTSDPAKAARGELGPSIDYVEGGFRTTALVPDGTSDVQVERSDGSVDKVPIVGNFVSTKTVASPDAVTWRGPDGRPHRFELRELLSGKG
jgi:hypothetical protein